MTKSFWQKAFSVILLAGMLLGSMKPTSAQATPVEEPTAQGLTPFVSPAYYPADTTGLPPAPTVNPLLDKAGPKEVNSTLSRPVSPGVAESANDGALQTTPGLDAMPSPIVNFEGVNNVDFVLPPDTNGEAGPNHYVQMVNLSMAIYDKTGTLLYGPFHPTDLWPAGDPCNVNNHGDPVVIYDQLADRWLVTQFALPGPFYQCIAVSKTGTPTNLPADWWPYTFVASTTKMNDYPKLGVWPDAYYMSANQFTGGVSWGGAGAWAFDRATMLSGGAATFIYFDVGLTNLNYGGMLPTDLDGTALPPAGSPNYFFEVDDENWIPAVDALRIWEFHVDWATPANSTFGIVNEPNATLATAAWEPLPCVGVTRSCIPQPGTAQGLDAIGDRLMFRAAYRNYGGHESVVLNHTVWADGANRAGVRWYEVRGLSGAPSIYQEGTFAPADTEHRWMASLAMDHVGNIGLGYSVSSSTVFPSIRYTGRLAGDPLGTMPQGEASVIVGSGSQTHSAARWGDYSDMTVDPVDDCTFWYTQEYIATTGSAPWQTRVASFKFPNCSIGPTGTLTGQVTDSVSTLPIVGANISATDGGTNSGGTTTGPGGYYTVTLPVATYTVTASAFGYAPASVGGVAVISGTTTTQNFALAPAAIYTIQGNVTDAGTAYNGFGTILTENFESWPPAGWTITNNGVDCVWESTATTGRPNYAGGSGAAADADSDWCGGGVTNMNTDLLTPVMDLSTFVTATLNFMAAYNDIGSIDAFSVDVSSNGGGSWTNVLLWTVDHNPSGPGEAVSIDLTPYLSSAVQVKFNYSTDGWDWYAIVDQVSIVGVGSNPGWPLYAKVTVSGAPVAPFWTDPATGFYSVDLPAGITYTFAVEAFSPGYQPGGRDVYVAGDATENFALDVNAQSCVAPGYQLLGGAAQGFEGGVLPAGWTIVDNASNCSWVFNDPGGRGNMTGGTGGFAIGDSDFCGSGSFMDTELRTPVLDFSADATVNVEFKYDFNALGDIADVDVSNDAGATWTNVWQRIADDPGPKTALIDISAYAANDPDVMVRWHYYNAFWAWWWSVDDVFIGNASCVPMAGGLALGNVTDANTGFDLTGSEVSNDAGYSMFTVATPDDPNVGNAFYTLFSPAGGHVFTATMDLYQSGVVMVTVPQTYTVVQDFSLGAGMITAAPSGLQTTLMMGQSATETLFLENLGSAPAAFAIHEQDGGFDPLVLGRIVRQRPNPEADTANWHRLVLSPVAVGDVLFQFDATAATGHACILGTEWALGSYWVTSGGAATCSTGTDNFLFQIAPNGTVLNSWNQNTTSQFGWRDLAFDGAFLYASDSGVVVQIDPATGATTGVTIPAPQNPARALAYDPATDHFWTANFGSSIYEFDRSGAVINTFANALAVYGAAWDMYSPGGPYLWVWSQDGAPAVLATQIDPTTGIQTGVSFQGAALPGVDNIAGGATIINGDHPGFPGALIFLGAHQADADTLVGYDLAAIVVLDVPWLSESPITGTLPAAGLMDVPQSSGRPVEYVPGAAQELVGEGGGVIEDARPSIIGLNSKPFAPEVVIYNNGPLVTHPGGGFGGADASRLQNSSLAMTTLGFGHAVASGFRVADDFTLTGDAYLSEITFFAYQTGSSTTSTINHINLRIWDGDPSLPGSSVIWGDTATNRLVNTAFSNIYRDTETTVGASNRPIMTNTAALGVFLPAGTYWLDWQTGGTLASGPWAPPVTILGSTTTGNGLQYNPTTSTWAPVVDVGGQDFPFIIESNAANIEVTFDAAAVSQPGDYFATLVIGNDTPYGALNVPVTMTVTPSPDFGKLEGTVTGLGYCDANPGALEDAQVIIQGQGGYTTTLMTDANGFFSTWLDQVYSPLTMTVNAVDHEQGNASGVVVTGLVTTTVDFDLRLLLPCVSTDAISFAATLDMGDTADFTMNIANAGAADTGFTFTDAETGYSPALRLPSSASTRIVGGNSPAQITIGDATLKGSANPAVRTTNQSPLPVKSPDATTITHSLSQTIMTGNSVSCNAGGLHTDNHYIRVFDLPTFGIDSDFTVSNVEIGIEQAAGATGSQPAEIRLYTLSGPLLFANLTLIGSAPVVVADQTLSIINMPVAGTAPAGSILVVDFFTPDGQSAGNSMFVGSNNLGQTSPTYLAAADCGVAEPTDTAAIGFPGMHLVMNVTGDAGGDAAWIIEDPISGTLFADSDQDVAITLDAGQVTQPGVYTGQINFKNDDPNNGSIVVPVTMTVNAPPEFGMLSGTVTGLGYCDANPGALEGAEVFIEGSSGMTWTLFTAPDGTYAAYFDEAESPLIITVSAADHTTGFASGVTIVGQQTTTQDFDLRFLSPCVSVDPVEIEEAIGAGYSVEVPLRIINAGALGTSYEVKEKVGTPLVETALPPIAAHNIPAEPKGENQSGNGVGPEASGGPDPFGYTFADSNEPDGPTFEWIEINATGTAITFPSADDDYYWPVSLSFPFNFYGTDYTDMAVATNGTVYFEDAYLGYSNTAIPGTNGYGVLTFIAHNWDDMYIDPTSAVWFQDFGDYAVFEYENVGLYPGGGTPDTWEVIVFANGNILMQYLDTAGHQGGSATIGIQGDVATGLQYSYNTATLSDGLAICFAYPGNDVSCTAADVPWLSETPVTGTVGADSFFDVFVTLDTMTYTVGTYTATLKVQTDDPMQGTINVPVTMHVVPPAYGVDVSSDMSQTGNPGDVLTYTIYVTSTSNGPADTFDISIEAATYSATLGGATVGPLNPGESGSVDVMVTIPTNAQDGEHGTVQIMAMSQGDNLVMATTTLTANVEVLIRQIFLPIILRALP